MQRKKNVKKLRSKSQQATEQVLPIVVGTGPLRESGRGHQRHRHQTKKNPLKSTERRRFFSCPSPCQVCVCVCECVCVSVPACVCECVRVRGLRKRSRFSPVEPETVTSSADSFGGSKHRTAVVVVIFVNKNKRRNNDGGHRAALVRVPWIILRR